MSKTYLREKKITACQIEFNQFGKIYYAEDKFPRDGFKAEIYNRC